MAFKRIVQQPNDPSRRVCTSCRAEKSIVNEDGTRNFRAAKMGSMNDRTYDGVDMPCIECDRKRQREAHRTPEARAKERTRRAARLEAHPELRDIKNAQHKANYDANKASRNEWQRANYAKNRDKILVRQSEKYRTDPDHRARVAEDAKRRRATPNGKASHQLSNMKRKLVLRGVAAKLTPAEWLEILEVHDHRCAYCLKREGEIGNDGKPVKLTQDHVVAISRGGEHTADNVVPACQSCNSRKNDRPVFFMARFV